MLEQYAENSTLNKYYEYVNEKKPLRIFVSAILAF